MRRWWHPKVCSALVFCGAMAVLVCVWRIDSAGRGAVKGRGCTAADLEGRAVRVEMAASPRDALALLGRTDGSDSSYASDAAAGACLRDGVEAQTRADNRLLAAYSALTLALFLFVGSLRFPVREGEPPIRWAACAAIGLLFALAMGFADLAENRKLLELIRIAGQTPLPPDLGSAALLPDLRQMTGVKLGSLALSAALLGLLWPSVSGRWLAWPIRLLAWSSAILLAFALFRDDPEKAIRGVGLLTVFWLAALVHAVGVAVQREVVALPAAAPAGPAVPGKEGE